METNEKYKRRPFMAIPVAEAYFPASSIEQARSAMFRCLNRGEGIAVVFGNPGLGKTLLLRVLAEDFQQNDLVVLAHACPRSVKAFYQQLLLGFHQTWCGCDENECRLFTLDFLQKNTEQKVVLLIDEAQRLTLPVMEELRVLLDLCNDGQVRFCVACAGTTKLEERLTSPRLVALSQRIVCRAWLDPFTGVDTAQYIDNALSQAGTPLQNIQFENSAKRLIHRLSEGVPRIVNQLCDALVYSLFSTIPTQDKNTGEDTTVDLDEYFTVREENVVQAWAALQQVSPDTITLSGPSVNTPVAQTSLPQVDSSQAVVEFGSLDDDDEPDESCEQPEESEKDDLTTAPANDCPDTATVDESAESAELSENENVPSAESCDEEIDSPSDLDLTYDRMIRERLLGDSQPEETSDFRDNDDFSETALTDTPSVHDPFGPSDATFEVDFNGTQTEFRCDNSHFQEDENGLTTADEYLEELLSLEGEVGLEADVVRQIRDIHQHLRHTRQAKGEPRELGKNPLAKLDFSNGNTDDSTGDRGRLAKNSSVLSAKQEKATPEKHFQSIFQQAYTKEKDK